jgi:hypothetical protein
MIDTVLKRKEQTRIFRDMRETIAIALEALKYEMLDEDTINQMLKEITKMTVKTPCNIIKHPSNTVKDIVNTPTIKINQIVKTQTLTCSEIKLYGINQINITFTIEAYEIQTPTKKYTIITNIEEVKPSY